MAHLSEALITEKPPKIVRAPSLDSCSSNEEEKCCDCDYITYGDAVFACCLVAPLVVASWRGVWGLLALWEEMFPPAQIYLLGIIVHISFALLRSHLLSRSAGAYSAPTGSALRWIVERILSRIYTYIFLIACIMHWKGGWWIFDETISAIVSGSSDSLKTIVTAAFTITSYVACLVFRSSRNIMAAPYFVVTDGKEATYLFTSRFKTTNWDAPESLDSSMRGSTAGLTDTIAGGSPTHAALLQLADYAFAGIVVAPAVVTYWKSTWTLLDIYIIPDGEVASAAVCAFFGLCSSLLLCLFQTKLNSLSPDRGRLTYYVLSRLYTCISGVACVSAWRGVWNLLNECTGDNARTVASTTVAAILSLTALRTLRNITAAPFAVVVDSPQDYFDIPTMFRTSSKETVLYVLDCVFSVGVIGSLVVFVWRGSWALLDIFLLPEDQVTSCWVSLAMGYALVILTFACQGPMRWAAARLHGAPRLLLADVYHLVSFFATVNVWRGVWGLLDVYLFPEHPKLSNWSSHIVSITLLILLNCSNSLLVRGVYIDAEEPAGECVVFPCHYLRLFVHKERTKKRHRRALAAAATAAARRSEDATSSVPLQMPDEKV